MMVKRILAVLAGVLIVPMLVPITAQAAATTVAVRPSSLAGWQLNRDTNNTTPYAFTNNQHSIGSGSLYVLPIGTNPADKFIAEKTLNIPAADLTNVAYDFMIGNGTAASANQYYLNVYAKQPESIKYYDCRFDYVPLTGSTTGFTTASFAATDTPVNVVQKSDSPACPLTLSTMPAGSTVSFVSLSLGDTTNSDAGLGGYFDKVVITTSSDTTTYDFEKDLTYPTSRDDCKNGGWATYTGVVFNSQRSCVTYVNNHSHIVKGDITYNAYSTLKRDATFNMNTARQSGFFHYVDTTPKSPGHSTQHSKYTVDVSSVKVAGNDAWFAGVVTSATDPSWVGQWLFAKVTDGTPDMISGSFTSQSSALTGVMNMTNPGDGPFNVLSGNVKVN